MHEHIGIDNYPTYYSTVKRVLKGDGFYLHHAITRPAKREGTFRRKRPEGDFARLWARLEIACTVWALTLVTLAVSGAVPLREFLILLGVMSGVMFLNQVRTLVAHLWENDGEQMSVTAQYLDSVNVPPPSTLPALWAPVGLRYHALHHLLPGVLGKVRRGGRFLAPVQFDVLRQYRVEFVAAAERHLGSYHG